MITYWGNNKPYFCKYLLAEVETPYRMKVINWGMKLFVCIMNKA